MLLSRVLPRLSRSSGRSSLLLSLAHKQQLPVLSDQLHSLALEPSSELVPSQVACLNYSAFNSLTMQRFGLSSYASPEPSVKENQGSAQNNCSSSNSESKKTDGGGLSSGQKDDMGPEETKLTDQTKESDSDSDTEGDVSLDGLKKLVAEKDELLKMKQKEMEKMQDKVLRAYAEMENVMDRTKREAENSKKFAIQSFAKSLLDVADNLGRASSVVKESFSKIDASKDSTGAAPLLKTLLEGVEMTEKQLAEVFKKFGVERFDPINEPFDPNRHNAVFQVPDDSKPPGTVSHVLKAGYVLYDRIIRPAEVGVTQAKDDSEDKGS